MIGYYTSTLPGKDKIGETPEGFLVCRDAVIGRSGYQVYKGSELLKAHGSDRLKELGLDKITESEDVKVFRPPEEVFHSDAVRSYEGKPFCDNHPPSLITNENIDLYQQGHVQNVRKGIEPLDSGDWPLIADIIVTHPALRSKIESGQRELSSGYVYDLAHENGTIFQRNIVGNHVALVPKGRAGGEAVIADAAPEEKVSQSEAAPAAAELKPQLTTPKKEVYHTVSKGNWKNLMLALGFKAFAQDAKPEDMAAAMDELKEEEKKSESSKGEDRRADDAHGKADDRKADDRKADDRHADDRKADDAAADDYGKRMHAALDRVLARAKDKRASEDADIEALKGHMNEYFNEEKGEEQHAEDADNVERTAVPDPKTESLFDATCEDEDAKDKKADDALVPTFAAEVKRNTSRAYAADAVAGAAFVLKMFKPHVAKAMQLAGPDSKAAKHLKQAFDTIATSVNVAAKRDGVGDYSVFLKGATERSEEAKQSMSRARAADAAGKEETPLEQYNRINKMYADHHRKPVSQEVN